MEPSFDGSVPPAENQMPRSWALFVEAVMRSLFDLDIAYILAYLKYDSPLQLVYKSGDQIIALRPYQLASYHYDNLLKKIIELGGPEMPLEPLSANDATFELFLEYAILSEQQRIVVMRGILREEGRKVMQMIANYLHESSPEEDFSAILADINNIAII